MSQEFVWTFTKHWSLFGLIHITFVRVPVVSVLVLKVEKHSHYN